MSLESAIASRNGLLTEIGKNALNIKYPKEFELYVIALELTDEFFKTIKYFVFPINPSSLEESKPQISNVKKTLGGVTVLKNPTFVPTEINLSGSFGRGFKILLGSTFEDFVHSFEFSDKDENNNTSYSVTKATAKQGLKQTFDERIKTGYGCIKILEEMVEQSKGIGANGAIRHLIFHNPALGNSYLVTAGTLAFRMSEQTNMIWNYTLPLKSIAPLESLYTQQQQQSIAKQLNVTAFMQKQVNKLLNTTKRLLEKGVDKIPQ